MGRQRIATPLFAGSIPALHSIFKVKLYKLFIGYLSDKIPKGHKIVTNLDKDSIVEFEMKIFINSLRRIAMQYADTPFHGWLCVQNCIELVKENTREILEEAKYFNEE